MSIDEDLLNENVDNPDLKMETEDEAVHTKLETETLDEIEFAEKQDEDYKMNDPCAKYQFCYDKTACFINDTPETGVKTHDNNEAISVSPGEGKLPVSILEDDLWDIKSFPILDPKMQNHMNADRQVRLTNQQYIQQRMFNINPRYANCLSWVYAATGFLEMKQMTNNINISDIIGINNIVNAVHNTCETSTKITICPMFLSASHFVIMQ